MSDNNEKKTKKGGAGWFSNLFGSGSSSVGGASGMGSAGGFGGSSLGGLSGLFASKAGILGMVLGGATIAAGVGVVYNFIGPSSKPVYSPDLFQNTYYEEEASRASQERAMSRDASAASASTLDMFREQAQKDGLSLGADGAAGGQNASADAEAVDASADASAEAPADYGGGNPGAAGNGMPKLQKHSGFGGSKGGGSSGTSIPRMNAAGGLSGGIGAKFQPVYRPPAQANTGNTSGMTASAARMKNSPKYAIPNVNKKGAYGQAKYAGKMGAKAMYSADSAGSRTSAAEAFTGETTGAGDVASPDGGAGLGGAGVTDGAGLKSSDPSLNSNESTPPKVPDPEDVDPWQEYEDMAMNSMMWAGGLILATMALSKLAKYLAGTVWGAPAAAAVFYAAVATAAAAIFFALKVVYAGFKMFSEFGQKMMGGIYILTGVMLAYKAYQALMSAYNGAQNMSKLPEGGCVPEGFDWGGKTPPTFEVPGK